ncbi:MAG TPA: hypothetical protein VFA12_08005 [Stellaceae bacterium]|nr:hypothetical protein [Stellaceae bacterium]
MMPRALPALRFDHALGAAAALLTALAVWPWLPHPPPPAISVAAPASPAAPPALELPPLASFTAVVERPLFSSSRRAGGGAKQAPGAAFAGRYRLLGLIAAGDDRRALLAEGPRVVELKEGDAVEGWRIKRIEQDRLILSSATGEAVLNLHTPPATPPAGAPGAR